MLAALTALIVAVVKIDLGGELWYLLVALVIPVIVEALTKAHAPAKVKAIPTLVASAITGLVQSIADSNGVISREMLVTTVVTLLIAITSYLGLYKPLGLKGSILPKRGLGTPVDQAPPTFDS